MLMPHESHAPQVPLSLGKFYLAVSLTGAGTVSNSRPPWIETRIPSTPCCTANLASSAVRTPFNMTGSLVADLSQ